MNLNIPAQNLQGDSTNLVLQGVPDTCPICHRSILPKNVGNFLLVPRDLVQAIFRCTNQACEEVFIATYRVQGGRPGPKPHQANWILTGVAPKTPYKKDYSETICGVSPSFVEIYNQTIAAEAVGLTEIVGIGLRKALEFLIKDFAIAQKPSDADKIRKLFLGNCIDTYVDDLNVKACAKRAVWLGNDETHYVRKWEDKDIGDLKRLVQLTVNWIENVIHTQKYIQEMDGKTA